jgi:UDP-glucose:(heptosyl)LPS alpha-1,3-glucosyltransferase
MINGLPVIASGCCGFAGRVRAAEAGIVLPEPFRQDALETAVARLDDPALGRRFSRNGIEYGRTAVPLDGLVVAADVIEHGSGQGARRAQAARQPAPSAPHLSEKVSTGGS